jgi:hypothetical protein
MICPSQNLALGVENFIDILERKIEAVSKVLTANELDKMWIGMLLLDGLKTTFPCADK